ncbi:MAG: hypothetical protein ACI8UR_001978 [Natronomonas sp.]|jgi:hypothetical protein|uniref:hypothetical protein n=1 Tax=Natronomonas sp. TaxID=2184060 RepID=UPI00398A2F8B
MRPITRNVLLVILGVLVVMLALGALPSYLEVGDAYAVEATAVEEDGPSVNVTTLSERRFPYTFGALSAAQAGERPARSEAYYTGPVGFKEAFTHTPFDEYSEFEGRNASSVERSGDTPDGDVAYVRYSGQRYRLEIIRVDGGA